MKTLSYSDLCRSDRRGDGCTSASARYRLPLSEFNSSSIVKWQSTDVVVMQQHSSYFFACSKSGSCAYTRAQLCFWSMMGYVIFLVW